MVASNKEFIKQREKEFLRLRQEGKSYRAIAKETGTSYETVRRYIINMDRDDINLLPYEIKCLDGYTRKYVAKKNMDKKKVGGCCSSGVYFFQAKMTGRIKIGHSVNPYYRLETLRSMNQDSRIKILLLIGGDRKKESELHRKFKKYHHHGEWFEPSQEILGYIENYSSLHNPQYEI